MDVLSYIIASRLLSCPGGNGANIKLDENGNITVNGQKSSVTEVKVLNNTGTILPTTGGNGTSLIYFLGAVLALVSGVVLITKQRMKNS